MILTDPILTVMAIVAQSVPDGHADDIYDDMSLTDASIHVACYTYYKTII